jgi:protein-S-isoprenylcysteine O-methyltransferase Ste14
MLRKVCISSWHTTVFLRYGEYENYRHKQRRYQIYIIYLHTHSSLSIFLAGKLGNRGEVYAVLQVFVVLLVLLGSASYAIPLIGPTYGIMKVCAFIGGPALVVTGFMSLRDKISPFVTPVSDELVTTGPYKLVRHPMYGGLIIFAIGLSMATESVERAVFTGVLLLLLVSTLLADFLATESLRIPLATEIIKYLSDWIPFSD